MNKHDYRKLVAILLGCYFLLIGCASQEAIENLCSTSEGAFVKSTSDIPLKVKVDESINIAVLFDVKNNCGSFDSFTITQNEEVRTIEVVVRYNQCAVCTTAVETKKTSYQFTPKKEGTHVLKFKSGKDGFLSTSIEVQPAD